MGVGEVEAVFREYLRGATREILTEVMAQEVSELCGPAYHPDKEAACYRAGSALGYVYMESRREAVVRPRVRKRTKEDNTEEVALPSYQAAQDASEAQRLLLEALVAAGSMRKVGKVVHHQRGSSKSYVSRLWQKVGREKFSELRHRPLDVDVEGEPRDWLALMLDGVSLADDLVAVVAVGITTEGRKVVLDFELGASENAMAASALVARVVERGFAPSEDRPLLVVLDGSEALRKAVMKHFPKARIQRCLVHKERNLKRYLARRDWPELNDHFDRLRKAQSAQAGLEGLRELDTFLKRKNQAARQSLHEAGLDLIRVHLLDTPSTLHRSLLSTNMIENMIHNFRHSSSRVNRWRVETDQAARWLATGLLSAEEGFQRLSHYRDLPVLLAHLKTKRDRKNLGALMEKLPDWLRKGVPQVDEVEDNGLSPVCVGAGSQAICVV
ncbi:IS256 family transposase [Candidatus Bipolaricaulota bacterium]|nr:IS256 family transposase [Candidatus Bipolaricaulota bacterium]